jgi:homoserine dehydrogenase
MGVVNIGIVGLGTVGGGLVRLLQRHHDDYLASYGVDLRLARACARSAARADELGLAPGVFTTDWRDVVGDPAVDVVVELVGGDHPATEIFEAAFAAGKHVVTANKSLLAHDMGRMAGLAHDAGVQLKCEAAAAGGIPIVEALERSFAGNEVLTIAGIVNGTTNYMLTRMEREGLSFAEVLADAQRLGYAEADPTADVDGWDAAAKMAVLATIGFNTRVELADGACVEGIRAVTSADVEAARRLGYRIKLLGVARKTPDGLDVRVHPAMIPERHQLASVDGVFNAVYVVGDAVGETMFYGAGAGSFPTASAVMGDVLALAVPLAHGEKPGREAAPYDRVVPMCPIDELRDRYYVRVALEDRPGMLGRVAQVFAARGVSLASVEQPVSAAGETTTLVVVTHLAREADVVAACAQIAELEGVRGPATVIRVEDTEAWKSAAL